MTNKLKAFLQLMLNRRFAWDGLDPTLRKYPAALQALLNLGQIDSDERCVAGVVSIVLSRCRRGNPGVGPGGVAAVSPCTLSGNV